MAPIGILEVGAHVPSGVVDNASISRAAHTTPEWIERATGIITRHEAPAGTPTSALAEAAVDELLRRRPNALSKVGTIIFPTSTPDQPLPHTAAILQGRLHRKLGLGPVATLDVDAVCTGFLAGLTIGAGLATQPMSGPHILVTPADRYPTIIDRTEPKTAPLFGDGAAAVLLGPVPDGFGFHAFKTETHGEYADYVEVTAGGTRCPVDEEALKAGDDRFRMQGRRVRDYALRTLPAVIRSVLDQAGMLIGDVDRWFFHQANVRLVERLAGALGVDKRRVPLTAHIWGNTGSASIPITLAHNNAIRPLQSGEKIVFAAIGGGMTTAAAVCTWWHDEQ
jgi:3-oxoacyl-(acyl-carrier-protein) synthase III